MKIHLHGLHHRFCGLSDSLCRQAGKPVVYPTSSASTANSSLSITSMISFILTSSL